MMRSTPEPPGPPGLTKTVPILVRRVGRRHPREGDAVVAPSGLFVVERHRGDGAFDAREVVATRGPGQRGEPKNRRQFEAGPAGRPRRRRPVQILSGATAEKKDGRGHASKQCCPRAAHRPSSLIGFAFITIPPLFKMSADEDLVVHRRTPDNGRSAPYFDETRSGNGAQAGGRSMTLADANESSLEGPSLDATLVQAEGAMTAGMSSRFHKEWSAL